MSDVTPVPAYSHTATPSAKCYSLHTSSFRGNSMVGFSDLRSRNDNSRTPKPAQTCQPILLRIPTEETIASRECCTLLYPKKRVEVEKSRMYDALFASFRLSSYIPELSITY